MSDRQNLNDLDMDLRLKITQYFRQVGKTKCKQKGLCPLNSGTHDYVL